MARRNLVIYGWVNAGKTTIINKLYNRLQNTDPNIVIYRERKQLGEIEDNDFSAIIIYKGKSIVFYSAGDYINSIDEAISIGRNYDILVCACHRKFHGLYKSKFNRNIEKKQFRKDISAKNEKLTEEIVNIIEELIQEIS